MRRLPLGARQSPAGALPGLDCSKIAARLYLSRRETQIVQEVCKGRSAAAAAGGLDAQHVTCFSMKVSRPR